MRAPRGPGGGTGGGGVKGQVNSPPWCEGGDLVLCLPPLISRTSLRMAREVPPLPPPASGEGVFGHLHVVWFHEGIISGRASNIMPSQFQSERPWAPFAHTHTHTHTHSRQPHTIGREQGFALNSLDCAPKTVNLPVITKFVRPACCFHSSSDTAERLASSHRASGKG